MKRICVGVVALLVLTAGELSAQRRCRTIRDGRVTVCERDRDRDRDRDRHRGRRDAGPIEFGIHGGYDFEEDGGFAGAQLRFPLVRQLALMPSADVFFDDSPTEWQLNGDVLIRPDALAGIYFGAGVAFLNAAGFEEDLDDDSETEVGFNLLAGIEGGRISGSVLRPFAEGRWTNVDDYDAFRLSVGINVPISGWR